MTDESASDEALLARAAQGDGAAFGQLFRAHADAVYSYCFHHLGTWSTAEDATSIVFLEAWRCRAKAVAVSGSLRPWLFGVATNVMRNQQRSARRYDAALYRLPPPRAEPDHADRVANQLDDERQMRQLINELMKLSRGIREAFILVTLEELSYAETAVALGIRIGTVRSRVARARAHLKRIDTSTEDSSSFIEVAESSIHRSEGMVTRDA
ncbi:RNA polymerase sigma factor [Frankia canadensis]|nr:RNA polymerase sigma factor [Frankia canadensis]